MKTNVFVVVPNWNGKNFLAACLGSLEKQTVKARLLVVDNCSSDGSVAFLQKNFPNVELVLLPNNKGFAGGVNEGIKRAMQADAEYVALFNNDAVADETWLEKLVACATTHPRSGIVTGKLMRDDKKHIDSTGDFYSTRGLPFPRGRNHVDKGQYDKGAYVFGASGGASLYRVKTLKDIGLFDEQFFAYFEDVDISFRAQLAGWKVRYTPEAVAYHRIGGTSSRLGAFSRYHSVKNFVLLYTKNMPGWLYVKYLPLFLLQLVRMLLGSLRDGQIITFVSAVAKAVLLLPATLKARRDIQKKRVVSTKDVLDILYRDKPPKVAKL